MNLALRLPLRLGLKPFLLVNLRKTRDVYGFEAPLRLRLRLGLKPDLNAKLEDNASFCKFGG